MFLDAIFVLEQLWLTSYTTINMKGGSILIVLDSIILIVDTATEYDIAIRFIAAPRLKRRRALPRHLQKVAVAASFRT